MDDYEIDIKELKRSQIHPRLEDRALVTGAGVYTDDLQFDGCAYGVVVRSSVAAAKIVAIDTNIAAQHKQAVGIVTAAELATANVTAIPFLSIINAPDGSSPSCAPLPILALDEVRYVGQPIVFVVADSRNAAYEMAELIDITYEHRDCVVDVENAVNAQAPQVDESVPNNVAAIHQLGSFEACAEILTSSAHNIKLIVSNNRIIANPLEPRASIGCYDLATHSWTLYCGNQGPHHSRGMIAAALGCDEETLNLCVQRLGGGFGSKLTPYPEDVLVLYAAKKFKRAVRWRADRSEAFLADFHSRDHCATLTVGFDASFRITAVTIEDIANLGAYPSPFGIPIATTTGNRVVNGVYHIPALALSVKTVLTHTVPTAPYRGAGRPEVIHRLEMILDAAAKKFNIDAAEIRRRNLISARQMPYLAHSGLTYDSGDFPKLLNRALGLADWVGFPQRKIETEKRGLLRGRGLACHIDSTSGVSPMETVTVSVNSSGECHFYSGTQEMGQGLNNTYVGIAKSVLDISHSDIFIHQGDTASVATGVGSYGSRSLMIGGAALLDAAHALIARCVQLGADALETEQENVLYESGKIFSKNGQRVVTIGELASAQDDGEINVLGSSEAPFCFPNGCYICEVEIDPQTGVVRIDRFTGVDDVGNVINKTIVHGQTHGGLAQGIGQALFEHIVYASDGQLLSGSTLDYALPRATNLPNFSTSFDETQPATTNLLGAKGAGESGAVGGPPAVISAVADAIPNCDVQRLSMPLTSEKVWRIIKQATQK